MKATTRRFQWPGGTSSGRSQRWGTGREADETRVSSSIRKKAFAGIDSRSRAVQRFRVDPERSQFCSKNLGSPLGFGSLFFRTCSLFLLSIELLPCLLELLLCSIAVSGELDQSQESAAIRTEDCKVVFGHLELDTQVEGSSSP